MVDTSKKMFLIFYWKIKSLGAGLLLLYSVEKFYLLRFRGNLILILFLSLKTLESQALSSLHEGSLEITLTVPLT